MHETVYDTTCNIINKLNDLLWGFGTIALVFGTGIYFTLRFKGFNVIHIVHIFKATLFEKKQRGQPSDKSSKGRISQFQALSTALAASMGTGNIIGVAAAVSMGGPGAVFWMWVSALFGTATGLAENVLGTKYQRFGGGPMGYVSHGAGMPRLAVLYAAACAAAKP